MEHIKPSEICFSSDSDDFIEDLWFTSPNASFDGSSVTSIPWAEDVVKQNQELWDRIEGMFYGEEPLPTNDNKLKNEIIEWTQHFPYLRIVGKSIPCPSSTENQPINHTFANSTINDEIISVHPPIQYEYKSARTLPSHRVGMGMGMGVGLGVLEEKCRSTIPNGILEDDIERCLRITSGPLLVRRMQNRTVYIPRTANLIDTSYDQSKPQPQPNKKYLKSAVASMCNNLNVGNKFGQRIYKSVDSDSITAMAAAAMATIPYSARSVKIPILKSENDLLTNRNKSNLIRIKTATLVPIHRPLRNSITLPSINIEPKYLNRSCNTSDAISALIHSNAEKFVYSQRQPVNKRRSESE